MESSLQNNKGMTFIEILVVMGIISILFSSFFYIWNTMDVFRKSRDSKRINDLQLLDTALKTLLFTERNINLGEENIIYTSLPDSSSTCGSYNLIPLFSPYSYRCQTSDNYLKVDGNGWLPINFTLGKILTISVLPIDPLNNKDYFYAYQVRYGRYKLTARFENKTNISKMANDGGFEPTLYEVGSDLFIPSPHSGLVGYWSFDEGTGTIAYDLSGYGNDGTLNNFNFTTTSGWTTGKIGKALIFDGSDDWVRVSNSPSLDINKNISVFAWVNRSRIVDWERILGKFYWSGGSTGSWNLNLGQGYLICEFNINGTWIYASAPAGTNNATSTWYFVGCVYDGSRLYNYVNGELKATSIIASGNITTTTYPLAIGATSNGTAIQNVIQGIIDEIRIYNRALSDSEIKYLYEATR
jgi:prepilin-type N-terminal cleavage/methylation domain-containing protein